MLDVSCKPPPYHSSFNHSMFPGPRITYATAIHTVRALNIPFVVGGGFPPMPILNYSCIGYMHCLSIAIRGRSRGIHMRSRVTKPSRPVAATGRIIVVSVSKLAINPRIISMFNACVRFWYLLYDCRLPLGLTRRLLAVGTLECLFCLGHRPFSHLNPVFSLEAS